MPPVVTDRVPWAFVWSAGLSVTVVSSAKTYGPIKMPFGLRTRVGPRNHVLMQSGMRASTGGVLATKSERRMLASTCLYSLYAWFARWLAGKIIFEMTSSFYVECNISLHHSHTTFYIHLLPNLCWMAPPVKNWMILLERKFYCLHAIAGSNSSPWVRKKILEFFLVMLSALSPYHSVFHLYHTVWILIDRLSYGFYIQIYAK